jgi:hypothetical protein
MLYHGTGNGSDSRRQLAEVLPLGGGQDAAEAKHADAALTDAALANAARNLVASQSRLAADNVTLKEISIVGTRSADTKISDETFGCALGCIDLRK